MANVTKYKEPVLIQIRLEKSTKEEIRLLTDNINDFVVEAIKSQIEYEQQAQRRNNDRDDRTDMFED